MKVTSEVEMADSILEMLMNTNLRNEISRKGVEYSREFSWTRTLKKTLEVYEELQRF
jgi:glycosyltransferase involved in cell wall biosynthesis